MKFFKKTSANIICIFITLYVSVCFFVISLTGFVLSAGDMEIYSKDYNINHLFIPKAMQTAEDLSIELENKAYPAVIKKFINNYDFNNMGLKVTINNSSTYSSYSFDNTNVIYSSTYFYLYEDMKSTQVSQEQYLSANNVIKYYIHINVSICSGYLYDDIIKDVHNIYNFLNTFSYMPGFIVLLSSSFIAFCIAYLCFIYKNNPEPVLKPEKILDKLPPSATALICISGIILCALIYNNIFVSIITLTYNTVKVYHVLFLIILIILISLFGTVLIQNTTRIIAGNDFIKRLILVRIYLNLDTLGKGILVGACAALIMIIFAIIGFYTNPLFTIIPILLVLGFWIWFMIMLKDLENTIAKYSKGEWFVSMQHSPLIIENINYNLINIGTAMQNTIEKSIRDERTKTELITNVSHDIKTPLTTIISYTDLLGRDSLTAEERTQYLETLTRSSARMKKLLEDLIEASKASTGNMELNIMPCNIRTLLAQSVAEYTDLAILNKLKIVPDKGEDEIIIQTDSAKLFRVFDNVLSNACKYSIHGSRIFIYVTNSNNCVQITFVNTSENEITISAEELTERFVRGDYSRNSEGSGLGLAIAKSITELLGGKLNITIDGDQFRLSLSFSTI